MKALKYVLIAAGAAVALVVIVAVFVVLTFDPNKYKPQITAMVKDRTGRTLAIEGKLGLSLFPSVGVVVGRTSLSEAGSSRVFARLDQARVSVALLPLFSRRVVVDRVALSGLSVDLVKRRDGKTNFDDLLGAGRPAAGEKAARPERAAPKAAGVLLDVAGVEIRSSALGWRDETTGNQVKATIERFETGRIASGVPGKLSLAAKVESAKPKVRLDIDLSGGYRLDFEKRVFALSGLELEVSDAAAGAATSVKGDAQYEAVPSAIRFDLAIDRIDVDKYLPPARAGARPAKGAPARGGAGAKAADEPIDLSALKGLNLKGRVRIDRLEASNVKAQKVDLGLQAAGGRLDVNPLSASLYEGALKGNASANAAGNRIALKAGLTGVSIGPLLHDAADNDLLEGRGNVALDVQAGGATVGAMKRSLAGRASFALEDGALKGVNLGELIRRAKALAGSRSAAEQASDRSDRTDFTELGASFVIRNGVAHNDDLSGKSPLLRLAGSGDVDIGANTVDYTARVSVVGTAAGQGGKELAELRGVTVPVKISGPLDAPRYRVDLGRVVTQAAKQRAEEKVKERLQDRLKGLLGR